MARAATVTIVMDADTAKIVKGVKKTQKSIGYLEQSVRDMKKSLKTVAAYASGFYVLKEGVEAVINSGFAFNRTLEDSIAGLNALYVATHELKTMQGDVVDVTKAYGIAQAQNTKILAELQAINAQTPHTLKQTIDIYKAMYPSMMKVGASTEDLITLTKQLSIAAGSAGIDFNQLLAGVDGLASGTVLANSEFGRFLNSLGLTNEKLKESDNVIELLKEKLSGFKAADTMSVALSNLTNEWDQLAATLTKGVFDKTKDDIKATTSFLHDLNSSLKDYMANIENVWDIRRLNDIKTAQSELEELKEKYRLLKKEGKGWFQSETNYNYELGKLKFLIASTERKVRSLKKTQSELVVKKKEETAVTTTITKSIKKQTRELSKQLSILKQFPKFTKADTKGYLDGLQDIQKTLEAQAKKTKQLEKQYADFMQSRYKSTLDTQIELAESAKDWAMSLDGVAARIDSIAKATTQYYVASLKGAKAEAEINATYAEQFEKYKGDELKTRELQAQKDKEIASVREATYSAELGALASLAGTMASTYEKGSKEAIAFSAVQSALGIASSWTAIANAWAQPWPANLAAVAMVTSAVMPIISQLGGSTSGGGGSVDYAKQRREQYKQKAEDYEEASKPITDRLDRQIDILEQIAGYGGSKIKLELDKALSDFEITATKQNIENVGKINPYGFGRLLGSNFVPYEGIDDVVNVINKSYGEDIAYTYGVVGDVTHTLGGYIGGVYSSFDFEKLESDPFGVIRLVEGLKNNREELLDAENNLSFLGYSETTDYYSDADIYALLGLSEEEYESILNDAQQVSNDFAMSVLESMQELSDAAEDFRNTYDKLTDSTYYADEAYKKAYSDLEKLGIEKEDNLKEYLKKQSDNIKILEDELSIENIELLQSQDEADLFKQIELTQTLSDEVKKALDEGALEALNFKDSIDLVADALAKSNENIKEYLDSFKSQSELLLDAANNANYTGPIAATQEELDALFETLSGGIDGLTDAELEFLEANRDFLDAQYEEAKKLEEESINNTINDLSETLNILDSIASTGKSVVDSLEESINKDYTLEVYKNSLKALTSITDTASQEYLDALNTAADYAKEALTNNANFNSYESMRYEQVRAKNEFGEIQSAAEKEAEFKQQLLDVQNDMLERLENLERLQTTETADTKRILDVQRLLISKQLEESA